jgi:hypothetical protein
MRNNIDIFNSEEGQSLIYKNYVIFKSIDNYNSYRKKDRQNKYYENLWMDRSVYKHDNSYFSNLDIIKRNF